MIFPKTYKCLEINELKSGGYVIVPIRYEDRLDIMTWRNEQIYHLRQDKPLTISDQDYYFKNVVAELFKQEKPNQILFSLLKNNECFGYGGLVHINWVDKNAEISFIMKTSLEKQYFDYHWATFLSLIERVSFKELNLHKIYVYAFDVRPHLYSAIEAVNYKLDATLKEHCFFNGRFIDVLIYSKFKNIK